MTFGDAMRAARKRRGIKQKDLAAMIGASQPYLSDIEHNRVPGGWRLRKDIAEVLKDPDVDAIVRPQQ